MKRFIFTLPIALIACNSDNTEVYIENTGNESDLIINQGDSIPLEDAIHFFDSVMVDGNYGENQSSADLRLQLDSLIDLRENNPDAALINEQIEELEASLNLLEAVEKDIARRDSMINLMLLEKDTIELKQEPPKIQMH